MKFPLIDRRAWSRLIHPFYYQIFMQHRIALEQSTIQWRVELSSSASSAETINNEIGSGMTHPRYLTIVMVIRAFCNLYVRF